MEVTIRGKTRHSVNLSESLASAEITSEAGSGKTESSTKTGLLGSVLGAVARAKSSLFNSEQTATSVDRASESNHALKNEKVIKSETGTNSLQENRLRFRDPASDHRCQATPHHATATGCESGKKPSLCHTMSHDSKSSGMSLKMPEKLSGWLSGIRKRDASDNGVHVDKPQELTRHTHQSNRRRRRTSHPDILECVDELEREVTKFKVSHMPI